MLFEEEFLPRGYDEGGTKRRTAVYARRIPNDFGSFGTSRRDHEACRRGPKSLQHGEKKPREGRTRLVVRTAFFAFNLLLSRLLFGPDGNSAKCID